jgi:hypothetical protein
MEREKRRKTGAFLVRLEIVSHKATIILERNGKEMDSVSFSVDNDLAKHLLGNIDTLLQKASVNPCDVEMVCACKDAGFTTERIAQTVVAAHRFALQRK